MAHHYCTNCSNPLDLNNHCSVCSQINFIPNDHQCAFVHDGKQCPAMGSISTSINGGRFFCGAHYRNRDNLKDSIDILNQYITFGVPTQKDWRDELIDQAIGIQNADD